MQNQSIKLTINLSPGSDLVLVLLTPLHINSAPQTIALIILCSKCNSDVNFACAQIQIMIAEQFCTCWYKYTHSPQQQCCHRPWTSFNTLGPRQNGRHFPDDILKCIFRNDDVWISLNFSLKFVPKVSIDNIPALVQIMAWRRTGDKPLSEPMMISLLTHICVAQPQWVNKQRWSKPTLKLWHG